MKAPPFLLLAALSFWGWQSGLLYFGLGMGVILESSRFIKWRWDFSEPDFRRIYNLCTVLAFALVAYLYANDDQSGGFKSLLHRSTGNNTLSGIHALTAMLRWLPMLWFLFIAAQNFSERESVPLSTISLVMLRRHGRGEDKRLNIAYPYFIICLFSAGIHENDATHGYFWGECVLIAWALWPLRARRFKLISWAAALLLVVILAYLGTRGIGQLASLVETYNAQWIARYFRNKTDPNQSITAIGDIGQLQLSGSIVIRLDTVSNAPPPDYLREASYVNYHSPMWSEGKLKDDFTSVAPETNGGSTYLLLPRKTNAAAASIACYLNGWSRELSVPEGLLPLPDGSRELGNLPAESVVAVQTNKTGAVSVAGPGFVIFNVNYAAVATIDSPPDTNWDWRVPTDEAPALDKIADRLKLSGASEDKTLLTVQQFFADNFTYRTWQNFDKTDTNGTPLARFLLSTHAGHCEYFATATVLLLRELKIPARYAVGYYVHEADGEGHYVVRERDAHAWCLVWDGKNKAWKNFDTTPASWVATEGKRASLFQFVSDFFSWLHFQFSEFRWSQANLRQYILWALVPVIPFLLYQIIFRRRRKPQRPVQTKTINDAIVWPGLDSEFYRLEQRLAARGVPRQTGESFSDWLERVLPEKSPAELRTPLKEILRLHYRYRFDPDGLNVTDRKLLTQKVNAVLEIFEKWNKTIPALAGSGKRG